MKQKVIAIVGPTAVGKTALSIDLAKRFNGAVISGDAFQIYRGLDIGTAKATQEEQAGVEHYLIDYCEPTDSFSVSDFQKIGRQTIQKITDNGNLPIIAGGSGLYLQALLYDFNLGGQQEEFYSDELRARYEKMAAQRGAESVWNILQKKDPQAAQDIHPNNVRRVIRALEVTELSGKPFSSMQTQNPKLLYDVQFVGLETQREQLYARINQRVDSMVESGLESEAKYLWGISGAVQAKKGIGYREFEAYFSGKQTLGQTIEEIKKDSRRYAKRQLTWFKNRMQVEWYDLIQHPEQLSSIEHKLEKWQRTMKEG